MIDLQIESPILKAIIALIVQTRLRTTCFPLLNSFYVDHADVATSPVELISANTAIDFLVPLDVFLVSRQDLIAAPNGTPNGSLAPANPIILTLQLATTGTTLSLKCIKADLGPFGIPLGPVAPSVEQLICNTIGTPFNVNMSNILTALGMPASTNSRVELVDNVVVISFDPIGNGVRHLFPGQEWGFFIDGQAIEQFATSQIPPAMRSRVHTVTPHWRPAGNLPHVDIDYAGQWPMPDPFPGNATFDGTISSDFSLTSLGTNSLRSTIHWSLHLHLNLGGLAEFLVGPNKEIVEHILEKLIADAMDPQSFGAIPMGDHTFAIDRPLPPVHLGGAQLLYGSVLASPAGMTIGGSVLLPVDPGKELATTSVSPLGLPFIFENCRQLAKSGSGNPRRNLTLAMMNTNGGVNIKGCGVFCNIEILSPNEWLSSYFNSPLPGTISEDEQISVSIVSSVAIFISSPVRFILQTARGVRLIDLGVPPPVQLDTNGYVINPHYYYIDNCLYLTAKSPFLIRWGNEPTLDASVFKRPPMEDPNWMTRQTAISIQLITLTALKPGELIQYQSKDHRINVTADYNGRAIVPVLRSASNQEPAGLIRVNRQALAGHFSVSTALFSYKATFPAGVQHRLSSTFGGIVELTTKFKNHIDIHEIGPLGIRKLQPTHEEIELNPQPLPPEEIGLHEHTPIESVIGPSHEEVELNPQPLPPEDIRMREQIVLLKEKINLRGIISLMAIPGFADVPISIASMADGSKLLINFGEDGKPRVAGTLTGPIGKLQVFNDWAYAADSERVSVYRVIRS